MLKVKKTQSKRIHFILIVDETSIYLSAVLQLTSLSINAATDGLGTRRIFAIYVAVNQNLSKPSKLILLFVAAD